MLAPLHPLRIAFRSNRAPHGTASPNPRRSRRVRPHRGQGYAPAGAPKGFPRGKQSARPALPCAPLVVCLNSGSLTAFGGCAHWARASLRFPQSPSGRSWRKTPRGINIPAEKQGGFPLAPLHPFGESAYQSPPGARGLRLRAHQRAFLVANNRRGSHCRLFA